MFNRLRLGSGTSIDPFQIWNSDDLYQCAYDINNSIAGRYDGKYWILMADIDLSNFSNWIPIGAYPRHFWGNFNGNGKKIYNLSINTPIDYAGLFGVLGAYSSHPGKVYNIGIENNGNVVNGSKYAGGIAAHIGWGSILRCYNKMHIHASLSDCHAGGIIGRGNICDSNLTDLYNAGIIDGVTGSIIGGVAGSIYSGKLERVYNIGTVGTTDPLQGVAGMAVIGKGGSPYGGYWLDSSYLSNINQPNVTQLNNSQMTGTNALTNMSLLFYEKHLNISGITLYSGTTPLLTYGGSTFPAAGSIIRIFGTANYDGEYTVLTKINDSSGTFSGVYSSDESVGEFAKKRSAVWFTRDGDYPQLSVFA